MELIGWLVTYVTPPIALLSLVGGVILARRRLRAAVFLAGWFLAAVAPLTIFSRAASFPGTSWREPFRF